jgi:hypothetical protein
VPLASLAGVRQRGDRGWGIRGLVALAPAGLPRVNEVHVDLRVLAVRVRGVARGEPDLRPRAGAARSRSDLNEVIKQGGRTMSGGGSTDARRPDRVRDRRGRRPGHRRGPADRSFAALSAVDLGFRTERLLVADTAVPSQPRHRAEACRFYRNLLPQLAAIPGVQSAAAVMGVPTVPNRTAATPSKGARPSSRWASALPQAIFTVATPGISRRSASRRQGRDFTETDNDALAARRRGQRALARASFPGEDASARASRSVTTAPASWQIVGIVAERAVADPALPPQPQLFMPFEQHPLGSTALTLVMRTGADPMRLSRRVVEKVRR